MRRVGGIGMAAALTALTACGSGATEGNSNEVMAEQAQNSSRPSTSADPASRADLAVVPVPATGGGAVPSRSAIRAVTARRCGWLHNPTPGNWWLEDSAGEWVLATQGGRQAGGMDELPDMSAQEWEEVNGHYGYGCACLTLTADPETREVAVVARPEPKPLAQCRADLTLPRP
jgi:hypothetical protein